MVSRKGGDHYKAKKSKGDLNFKFLEPVNQVFLNDLLQKSTKKNL